MKKNKLKILLLDIETSPIIAHVWKLWDNNVGLNQIEQDWHVIAWAAKYLDEKKIMYMDQRNEKDITKDKRILLEMWKLLNDTDIIVTQNGKKFDIKKLNARFILNGIQPPSSFKHIDTLQIAKKYFGFTSNKLEYMSNNLNSKHKKMTKRKFAGHDLWMECLKGNKAAWNEMEKYNKLDVLSLEEVYKKLIPWDSSTNFTVFNNNKFLCTCGSTELRKNGFAYLSTGKYQRFECVKCHKEVKGKKEKQ